MFREILISLAVLATGVASPAQTEVPTPAPVSSVFQNVAVALSFAANRDFLASLKGKTRDEVTKAMEQKVADEAIAWWKG